MVEGSRLLQTLQEGLTRHSSKHSPPCYLSNLCICITGWRGLARLVLLSSSSFSSWKERSADKAA